VTQRNVLIIIGVVVLIGIIAVGVFLADTYIRGGSGEASAPISAPTLSVEEAQADDEGGEATADEDVEADEMADADGVLFRIVPEDSEVHFTLDEVLQGTPTTVIGRTDQVAGDIVVDFAAPANSQVGTILINARTLLTDNEFRNRALRSRILESAQDEFEFSEFAPTALEGLPESVTIGEPLTFQIVGDLTVRDITNPVTFEATVTPVSETRLEGSATATVLRADYNLIIPDVPGVANVSEEVLLEIDFVALAVEE
jgi:polyisoprenoid-binding protein YceI